VRWWCLPLALWATTLSARELPPRPLPSEPSPKAAIPSGYVFENPQLLTQQLLWGVLHGVRLLGITCQARGYTAAAEAYLDWMDNQGVRVRAAERDLARHYFQQENASPEAISAALLLKATLDISPAQLAAACDSLPQALKKERYDLEKFYADRRATIEKGDPDFPGAVWIEPTDLPSQEPILQPEATSTKSGEPTKINTEQVVPEEQQHE